LSFSEQIADPLLRELYAYWQARRGARFAPARRDLDPLDLPRLLPHLLLTEVVTQTEPNGGHQRRYRYRLAGTEVERHFGCSMGGRWIDELMQGRYRGYVLDLYERLVASRRPIYSQSIYGRLGLERRAGMVTRRLMLPLSGDGEMIDMVLSGQTFQQPGTALDATVLAEQGDFEALAPADPAADDRPED